MQFDPPLSGEFSRRRNTQAGFTLIEILVALTLLGLIIAILAGGLQLGVRVWETKGIRSEQLAETQIVHTFLRRLVEQAYLYHGGQHAHVTFDGRHNSLSFVAPLPSHVGYGGFHRVQVLVERQQKGRQLTLRYVLLHPDVDPQSANSAVKGETILLRGIENVEISYFGSDASQGQPSWRNTWTNRDQLPDLVRIDVQFPRTDARIWPSLVAAPMIGFDTSCVREPKDDRCQRALLGR